jgi:CHASE2 domain-containing sensor protein
MLKHINKHRLFIFIHALISTIILYFLIPVLQLVLDPFKNIPCLNGDPSSVIEMSDLYHIIYAYKENNKTYCPEVEIVYVDDCKDREEIAQAITKINQYKPKIIGVDLQFNTPIDDRKDSILKTALLECDNIVVACWLDTDSAKHSYCFYNGLDKPEGFINLEGSQGQSIIRNFIPSLKYLHNETKDTIYSLSAEIVRQVYPEKFRQLQKQDKPELINYQLLEFNPIYTKDIDEYKDFIENRIVLVGSFQNDWHSTPIHPQMRGVEIHAYTLATMLGNLGENRNIKTVDNVLVKILTFIITYCFVLVCFIFLKRLRGGASLVIRILQLILLAIFLCLGYVLFIHCHINIVFSQMVLTLAFASLVTDIYIGILEYGKGIIKNTRKNK